MITIYDVENPGHGLEPTQRPLNRISSVFVGGPMSYLSYLRLFAVFIMCLVYLMLLVSMDCPFCYCTFGVL